MKKIPLHELELKPHDLWENQWLLLSAGDFKSGDWNCMTVAWGSLGCMWSKPFASVVVRPTRHTYRFMEEYDEFTLSAFGKEHREALLLLGTKSGRDGDKVTESGLTPIKATRVDSPLFAEAVLSIECRKNYWTDIDNANFLDEKIEEKYPNKDYHRMYFGEVIAITTP